MSKPLYNLTDIDSANSNYISLLDFWAHSNESQTKPIASLFHKPPQPFTENTDITTSYFFGIQKTGTIQIAAYLSPALVGAAFGSCIEPPLRNYGILYGALVGNLASYLDVPNGAYFGASLGLVYGLEYMLAGIVLGAVASHFNALEGVFLGACVGGAIGGLYGVVPGAILGVVAYESGAWDYMNENVLLPAINLFLHTSNDANQNDI